MLSNLKASPCTKQHAMIIHGVLGPMLCNDMSLRVATVEFLQNVPVMFFLLLRINGPLFFRRNILPSDQLILPVNSQAAGSCQPVPNLVSGQCDAGAANEYIAAVRRLVNGGDAIINFFLSGGHKDTGTAHHALDDAVVGGPVFQHRRIWCFAGGGHSELPANQQQQQPQRPGWRRRCLPLVKWRTKKSE
jgi:hypothetical protein